MSKPNNKCSGAGLAALADRSTISRTDARDVAVIVPCYNDGETVAATVASALRDVPSEIIVVDDGSDDQATLDALDALAGRGLRVIRQPNSGLPAARMAAVNATSCPYILPLDADDLVEPGALIDLAAALDRDDGLAVVFGNYETFGEADGMTEGTGWDPWTICHVNRVPGGGVLIRRDALLNAGGWSLQRGYEDWDLWMSLLERGERAAHIPRTTFHYRIHGDRMLTATRDWHPELYSELRARHPKLFAARSRNWRRSSEPIRTKLALPIMFRLPGVSMTTRHRLALFLYEPVTWRSKASSAAGHLRSLLLGAVDTTSRDDSVVH